MCWASGRILLALINALMHLIREDEQHTAVPAIGLDPQL